MFASILGAMPPTGGQVVLESTPKGNAGFFYDHWQDATLGSRRYHPHFYPWFAHDSYRLPLAPGEIIRPHGKLAELEVRLLEAGVTGDRIKWYRDRLDILKGDVERLKQEYPNDPESCFLGSGDQYIPNTLIEACMHYDPIPSFDGPTFGGVDFGRTNDLTSIVTAKQDRAGRLWVVNVETCRRTDWDTQVATILTNAHNWRWKRCAVDATGMGSMPSEQLAKALGERRVDRVMFNEGVKEQLATGGFAAIGERMLRLPDEPALIGDIRAIQRIVEPSGKIKYDAPRTKDGHADRAWALFLAIMAAGGIDVPHPTKQELGAGDFANPYRTTR
jgi:phage FluMu gp28-like protein